MRVNATAYLYYNEGESMSSGWEGLYLYVKFKEKGNLFRTKLSKCLASTFNLNNVHLCEPEDRFESYEDYYEFANEVIGDYELIREVAVEIIEKHFKEKNVKSNKNKRKEDLVNRVGKMPKLEITVEIKE